MTQKSAFQFRFLAGLIIALIIGIGIEQLLLLQARRGLAAQGARRIAIIKVQSLVDIVEKAGGEENVSATVAQYAKQHPYLKNIRAVKGFRLLASTVPSDTGDKATPRRLNRDEKSVYDLGQKLRSDIQTNRDEGVSRKEEIDVATTSSGSLVISSPVEEDDAVVGYVQVETTEKPAPVKMNIIPVLAAILLPVLIFGGILLFAAQRKAVLAIAAFALLFISLFSFGHYAFGILQSDLENQTNTVARAIQSEANAGTNILEALNVELPSPLEASKWDVDVFRRPTVPDSLEAFRSDFRQALLLIAALSAGILALIGFGVIARLFRTVREHHEAYAYTLPAMVGMVVLVFFPFIYGIVLSFTGSTLYNTDKSITEIWVGFQNYKDILMDLNVFKKTAGGVLINYANFFYTFVFTIFWTVTNVAFGVTMGLILALILNTKGLALKPVYRVLLILPWAMPNYITALIWKGMFHQQFGVINQVIQLFGGDPISWFQRPFTSYLTAYTTNAWLSFPFMMVVSLGALQSIPADLYEAARVDGATKWQQFRSITLPSLKPALIPAIILSVVWTFNMFNIIYLVTQGEPAGSTEILITEAYKIAFEKYRYGYAAAYSTIIFLILLIYGSIQNRVTRATEAIAG